MIPYRRYRYSSGTGAPGQIGGVPKEDAAIATSRKK